MNTRSIRFRLTVWYAGLLAGLLVLFGFSVNIGLRHYLEWTLREALSQQAKQIGEAWLGDVGVSGKFGRHIGRRAEQRAWHGVMAASGSFAVAVISRASPKSRTFT